MSPRRVEWPLTGVLVLVVLASGHAVLNDFVWDDVYLVGRSNVIHDPRNLPRVFASRTMYASSNDANLSRTGAQTYRPVTIATFFWDSMLSGRMPLSYHVTNLLVHLMVVLLVFSLARRLSSDAHGGYAALGAAWFGLTPLPAEAYVWIDGRSDLFCTLFVLVAVGYWRDARGATERRRRVRADVVAGVSFLLALLSKEPALFVLPALVFWPSDRDVPLAKRLARLSGFGVAAVVYFAMRAWALGGVHAYSQSSQLRTALFRAPTLLLDGLTQSLVPTLVTVRALSLDYDALGNVWLAVLGAVALALAGAIVWLRKREPLLFFCSVWFASTLAPAAFLTTTLWPGFGRFLYLPAAGLAPLVGSLAARALTHPRIVALPTAGRALSAGLALWVLALGVRQHLWVYDWHDELSLYTSWITAQPDRAHGYGWLGFTYLEHGNASRALPLLQRAWELAPGEQRYAGSLASTLLATGQRGRAAVVAEDGIRRFPPGSGFRAIRALAVAPDRPDAAASELVTCLEREPSARTCREAFATLSRADPRFSAAVRRLRPAGLRRGASTAR